MFEDYIDFPVSDDWLDYYHKRGLTPRNSGRMDPEVKVLYEKIEKLEQQLLETNFVLKELVVFLQTYIKKDNTNKKFKKQNKKFSEEETLLEEGW